MVFLVPLAIVTMINLSRLEYRPTLQMGRYEFGVYENNDVNSDIYATTTTTVIVIRNGWKHISSVVNAKW